MATSKNSEALGFAAISEAARRRLFFEQQVQQAKDKLTEAKWL